jgi:SAM-dependent methyltransferase
METKLYNQIQAIERTHWWYVARRKIIFDWVFRTLADRPAARVLDIGCGTGFNIEQVRARHGGQVVGLDLSTDALTFCRSRNLPDLVGGDGTCSPFRSASFDVIMALDLVEHLDDDQAALRELARLLRPGGTLIIFAPAFNFLWGLQDDVSHHRRRYTAGELSQKLDRAGLCVAKLSYANMALFPLIWGGRAALRLFGHDERVVSENDLHPGWSNGLLQAIFAAERPLLRRVNFPFGVSLLCVAKRRALPTPGSEPYGAG